MARTSAAAGRRALRGGTVPGNQRGDRRHLGSRLGLTRGAILGAVAAGVGAGALLLAWLAHLGREPISWLFDNPIVGISVLVACLILTVWLGRWFAKSGRQ